MTDPSSLNAPAALVPPAGQHGPQPWFERLGAPLLRLHEAWLRRRDRWLADPAFRRWAARAWPSRAIARRQARQAFDLVAGFAYAQTLAACMELRLFERLSDGPRSAEELARAHGLKPERLTLLLDAACALQLLQRRAAGYGLGALGAPFVANAALEAMIAHHKALYADLAAPVELLKPARPATQLERFWPYTRLRPDQAGAAETTEAPDMPAAPAAHDLPAAALADYSRLMGQSQTLVAEQVLDAYPIARHRRLLDLGGGDGSFIIAAARRAPGLQVELFDLPAVAALAQEHLRAAALDGRARVHGGDFHRDPLPQGYDLLTLVRVVHDHDDAPVLALLRRARSALVPGGTLLIAEPMAGMTDMDGHGDGVEAYFLLYLLAMGSGRPRSADALGRLLRQAGFRRVRRWRTAQPLQCALLSAERGHD